MDEATRNRLAPRGFRAAGAGLLVVLFAAAVAVPLAAQSANRTERTGDEQPSVRQQVDQLVERLATEDEAAREAALGALLLLPPEALPQLRDHLERTEDPEVRWRLMEAIDALETRRPPATDSDDDADDGRGEARPRQQGARPEPRSVPDSSRRGGWSFQTRATVLDSSGRWQLESRRDGRLTVTFTPRGENASTETREFDSFEQMQDEWPEAAQRFRHFSMRSRPGPRELLEPNQMEGMQRQMERMWRQMEELQRSFEEDGFLEDWMRQMQRMTEDMLRNTLPRRLRRNDDGNGNGSSNQDGYWYDDHHDEWMRRWLDGMRDRERLRNAPEPPAAPRQGRSTNNARDMLGTVDGTQFRAVSPAIRAQLQRAEGEGLLVDRVGEAGPLTRAGVQRYDLLLAIDGTSVRSVTDVQQALDALPGGAEFTLSLIRRGERVQVIGRK